MPPVRYFPRQFYIFPANFTFFPPILHFPPPILHFSRQFYNFPPILHFPANFTFLPPILHLFSKFCTFPFFPHIFQFYLLLLVMSPSTAGVEARLLDTWRRQPPAPRRGVGGAGEASTESDRWEYLDKSTNQLIHESLDHVINQSIN